MKRCRRGFTIIELLTVIAIIALLMSILLPSLSAARRQSKDVNVKAFIHGIETGLEMFRNERGEYPASDPFNTPIYSDPNCEPPIASAINRGWFNSGMSMLAEAMVGHDRQGFDPTGDYFPLASNRCGPYVKVSSSGVYIYDPNTLSNTGLPPWPTAIIGTPMLLDPSYHLPVLYYRASPAGQTSLAYSSIGSRGYYQFTDNGTVTGDSTQITTYPGWQFAMTPHLINNPAAPGTVDGCFDKYITDPRSGDASVPAGRKPYNADSFLLIHPGYDRIYGTRDDVRNWIPND
jgi:prepilin-type N-terminal cleavage/methylation domain-containing protein